MLAAEPKRKPRLQHLKKIISNFLNLLEFFKMKSISNKIWYPNELLKFTSCTVIHTWQQVPNTFQYPHTEHTRAHTYRPDVILLHFCYLI